MASRTYMKYRVMSRTYMKYRVMIEDGIIGKPFVRGLSRGMNDAWRRDRGYSVGQSANGISAEEIAILQNLMATRTVRVEEALTRQGVEWLASRKVQKHLGNREREIVASFSHYTIAGFWEQRGHHMPIWRVHDKAGRTFTYYTGSWQSGIPLTVIG
jgi:hypothetical protein